MATSSLEILITAKDEASKIFKEVGGEAGGLGSKLQALIPAIAAVGTAFLSFKEIEGAIHETQELGGEISKLSRETGLTAESASQLLFAFKHVGLGADDASRSLGIFSKNMTTIAEAQDGEIKASKTTTALLHDLGVQALDTSGNVRPMSDLIKEVSDHFVAMPNGIEKTGMAMQLFGRSGKDMIPLLNLGSQGLEEMGKEAQKLGLVLSGENVADIKAYTLAQRDMDEAIAGVKLQIGLALMPVLTELSHWFIEQQPIIREYVENGINFVRGALIELSDWFAEHRDEISDWANRFIEAANWMANNLGTQIASAIETFNALKDGVEAAIDLVDDLIHGRWQDAWADLKQVVVNVGKAMLNDILMIFGQIPNLMISAVEKGINGVISLINQMPELDVPDWVPGIGGNKIVGGEQLKPVHLGRIDMPSFDLTDVKNEFDRVAQKGKAVADAHAEIVRSGAELPPAFNHAATAGKAAGNAASGAAPHIQTLGQHAATAHQAIQSFGSALQQATAAATDYWSAQSQFDRAYPHGVGGGGSGGSPGMGSGTLTGAGGLTPGYTGYLGALGSPYPGYGNPLVSPGRSTGTYNYGLPDTGWGWQSNPAPIVVQVQIDQREIGRAIVDLQAAGGLRGVVAA